MRVVSLKHFFSFSSFVSVYIGINSIALSEEMSQLNGKCVQLVAVGVNYSKNCQSRIVSIDYGNGRNGYWFFVKDGSILSFAGEKNKIIFNPNGSAVQSIDQVTFASKGGPESPSTAVAVGSCSLTNPYRGKAVTVCKARITGGAAFLGSFRSNGFPPH